MEKVYIENILKKEISDVALSRFEFTTEISSSNKVKNISEIFEYKSLDEYLVFVKNIVNEINLRNNELEKNLQICN